MKDFDRRWIFLAMGVVVVGLFALDRPSEMPVSEYVQSYYDTIEELPENSIVLLSADFDPASAAELLPTYQATIHHLMRRNIRVVNIATWPAAPPYTRENFDAIAPLYGKSYGTDWVELGFKPGDDVAMGAIGQSIRSAFNNDARESKPVGDFPLMQEVGAQMEGIAVLITMSAGYPGILEWIAQVGGRYQVPILTATTAVQTPDLYAYYPTQLSGFAGAATGATQYLQLVTDGAEIPMAEGDTEGLVGVKENNQARMLIQAGAHMLILLLIVIGNVLYFTSKGSR